MVNIRGPAAPVDPVRQNNVKVYTLCKLY
jgi:hypothetical protein